METFSALLALREVNGKFPSQSQWRGALIFSLIWAGSNGRDAGDLRRHRAVYDVTVMSTWRLGRVCKAYLQMAII